MLLSTEKVEAIIKNKILLTNIPPELEFELKDKLTIANPDYKTAIEYNQSTEKIPRFIQLYDYVKDKNGKVIGLLVPQGVYNNVANTAKRLGIKFNVTLRIAPKYNVKYPNAINLYDYQEAAVDRMRKSKNGILISPAGSGKTQMGIALAMQCNAKLLWLTHTLDLVNQSYERAAQFIDEKDLGKITEGKCKVGNKMTFATVQTLVNQNLAKLYKEWDMVIVDECHRAAGSYTNISMFSKILTSLAPRRVYGLTATPYRKDGLFETVESLIGPIIYTVSKERVKDKIMQVQINTVKTAFEPLEKKYCRYNGKIDMTKLLTLICNDAVRNRTIVNCIVKGKENQSLILSDRIGHLELLYNMLPDDMREKSIIITGSTKKGIRQQEIEQIKKGNIKYLFATYALAKEGLDIPCLSRLYMATPKSNEAVVIQSVGRIARTDNDKKQPVCYDFLDSGSYFDFCYEKRCGYYRDLGCKLKKGEIPMVF